MHDCTLSGIGGALTKPSLGPGALCSTTVIQYVWVQDISISESAVIHTGDMPKLARPTPRFVTEVLSDAIIIPLQV